MISTIVRSPYEDVTIPDLSLPEFVFADAAKWADKPALVDGPSGRALTFGELVRRSSWLRWARAPVDVGRLR